MRIKFVGSNGLGSCPAQVDMITGTIELNRDVWSKFTKYEQAFIIEHEKGHFLLPTDYEKEADAYALRETCKITPDALKHAVDALIKMDVPDKTRIKALYNEIVNIKNNKDMRPKSNNSIFNTGINRNPFVSVRKSKRVKNRADGDTPKTTAKTPVTTTTFGKSHKRNGLVIGDVYLSITNLLLLGIFLVGIITAFRSK